MAIPMRKEDQETEVFDNREITTADLARPRPDEPVNSPRPVAVERTIERVPDRKVEPEAKGDEEAAPLFPNEELETLRSRWKEVQIAFVDEPRKAVEQADSLVASTMKRLAEVFANERSGLEKQWDRGDNVSTEDLRVALQRYRTFFHRLMAV